MQGRGYQPLDRFILPILHHILHQKGICPTAYQYIAPDSGLTILEFHFYALNSGQNIAPRAEVCPSFETVIAHYAK